MRAWEDGKEDAEGYERRLNGGCGSSVCCVRRVRAQPARSSASTDLSDASRRNARGCGRRDNGLVEQESACEWMRISFLRIIFPRVFTRLRERGMLFPRILVVLLVEGIALETIKCLPAIHSRRVQWQGVWRPRTAELGWDGRVLR